MASLDVNNLYSNYLIKIIKKEQEEKKREKKKRRKKARRAKPIIEMNSKFHTQIMTHTQISLLATEAVSYMT